MSQISVIVPVYKVEKYLHRCVDSILAQTFTDFELILVDDGSPDNCGAICDEYAQKDSRVVVIHQENGGLSAARNAGIDWSFEHSDSEWIYFADSDDWIHPKSLEALMDGAEKTGCSVVIGGFESTKGEEPIVDETAFAVVVWDVSAYFRRYTGNAIVAWGKLYRKESFRSIRYPVGKIHEDEFTTHKILFEFDQIAVIDQPLYAYFQNAEGITGSAWNPKMLDVYDALDDRIDFFQKKGFVELEQSVLKYLFFQMYLDQKKNLLCSNSMKNRFQLIQEKNRLLFKKRKKELKVVVNKYDYLNYFVLAYGNERMVKWIIQNDFEPIQNIIRRIKRL